MDAITILDDVVDQLTDHFEKTESVNYLYNRNFSNVLCLLHYFGVGFEVA